MRRDEHVGVRLAMDCQTILSCFTCLTFRGTPLAGAVRQPPSQCQSAHHPKDEGETCFNSEPEIPEMVEPDGIEPTT